MYGEQESLHHKVGTLFIRISDVGLTFKNGPSTLKVERIMEYQKEFCMPEAVVTNEFGVDSFIWEE